MAEKMNGFNFGTTMKKIFFAIIALAALVGCNTNVMEEVATTPAYLTTSFEVDLNGESRAFDKDLNWSWKSTDEIAAFQFAGEQTVNKLTLKDNGKFGTDEFKYATPDPATFVFVYPFAAYDAEKQDVGYVQTGEWTPTLVGIVENATVNNIGTVEMNHMSAAFEIRVWDEGSNKDSKTLKNIKEATITSKTDGGVSASLTNRSTNTVVFNVAGGEDKGKNVVYDIKLVDENDRTYTISNKELNFVNGKRTILNVEWKYPKPATVSFLAYSSYNESDGDVIKNDNLSGNTIYVKDVVVANAEAADVASVKLLLNGSERADITSGSATVSGLGYGAYTVSAKLTLKNGYTYTTPESVVYVTGIPYHADWRSKDYSDWKYTNCKDNGSNVRINCHTGSTWGVPTGGYVVGGVISPEFGIPAEGLSVYTSVAASTRSTDASQSDRCYIKAGNRSASHDMEKGDYVNIYYSASGDTFPNTSLVLLDKQISLTTSNRCLVYSGETYRIPVAGTNLYTYFYQIKITYNKQ